MPGHYLSYAERSRQSARWLLVLIVGAGLLLACSAVPERDEGPAAIADEAVPGLTALTPGEADSFQNPTWSPDGRYLAYDFVSPAIAARRLAFPSGAEIQVIDLETGRRRKLTDNDVADVYPAWSPNGQQIAFVRNPDESEGLPRPQLMLTSADGRTERILFNCPGPCLSPDWSPDGEFIAFWMGYYVWTIRSDGSDLSQVSGRKVVRASDPTWSPDGQRIAYWATLEEAAGSRLPQGNLAVLDLSTGEENIVAPSVGPVDPDWSPTGSSILYSAEPAPNEPWTLFAFDLNSATQDRLIRPDLDYDVLGATWSPDGKRIAFAYGLGFAASHLYVLDLEPIEARASPQAVNPLGILLGLGVLALLVFFKTARIIIGLTLLGMFLGACVGIVAISGIFVRWEPLGAPPGGAVEIVQLSNDEIHVRAEDGETYSCDFRTQTRCWVRSQPDDAQQTDESEDWDSAYFATPEFSVSERSASIGYWHFEAGGSKRWFELRTDGGVWTRLTGGKAMLDLLVLVGGPLAGASLGFLGSVLFAIVRFMQRRARAKLAQPESSQGV